MALIVAKFGGTSVADVARIEIAAGKIAREIAAGHRVAVVVSAMAGVTNQLVGFCDQLSKIYDAQEYDAIVSSGEQITAGLMALALQKRGITARSYQGWQIPIRTDDVHGKARIQDINAGALQERLNAGEVVVVPGFQGVTSEGRITTLGRGGSDTTAVALAAALKAERCDIYTDVDGVYTTDPRIVPRARKIKKISCEEMMEMASLGAKVLQIRSVEIAMKEQVCVQVLSSFEDHVGSDLPGTLVVREEDIMEKNIVTGIAYSRDEVQISLLRMKDEPGIAARIFEPLAAAAINVDMIVQNVPDDGRTNITFTILRTDLPKAQKVLSQISFLKGTKIVVDEDVAKVSIVGIGMISHHGVASTMFRTLADRGINIQVISTSEIKISVLIQKDYMELAVRALHEAFGLDQPD